MFIFYLCLLLFIICIDIFSWIVYCLFVCIGCSGLLPVFTVIANMPLVSLYMLVYYETLIFYLIAFLPFLLIMNLILDQWLLLTIWANPLKLPSFQILNESDIYLSWLFVSHVITDLLIDCCLVCNFILIKTNCNFKQT